MATNTNDHLPTQSEWKAIVWDLYHNDNCDIECIHEWTGIAENTIEAWITELEHCPPDIDKDNIVRVTCEVE